MLFSASDPMVDDLCRPLWEGLERMDRAELVELFRKSVGALGPANPTEDLDGEGSGEI